MTEHVFREFREHLEDFRISTFVSKTYKHANLPAAKVVRVFGFHFGFLDHLYRVHAYKTGN